MDLEDVDLGHPDLDNQNHSTVSERAADQNLSLSFPRSESPPPPSSSQSPLEAWQPLDPHQQLRTPRPLKVKATRRFPPSLRAKKKPNSPIMPISQFQSQQQHLADNPRPRRLEKGKETQDQMFDQEESEGGTDGAGVPVEEDEADIEEDEDKEEGCDSEEDEDEEEGYVSKEDEDEREDFHLPDPHQGGDLADIAVENDGLSYEELVEDFITRSKRTRSSSELSQRVSRWQELMEPKLESLERRKPFDIHDYGTRILSQVQEAGREEVAFREIVRGQQKEEISRYDSGLAKTFWLYKMGKIKLL